MDAIQIKKLTKSYGAAKAVDDISLSVKNGDFFGFIGPNGAGKTTTIKSMLNLLHIDAGQIYLLGRNVNENRFQAKIGYIPSEANMYDNLTVNQQIKYFASYYPHIDLEYLQHLKVVFNIDESKHMSDLSSGNKKKVAVVCALMNRPELIVADEASNSLDPLMQQVLFFELNALNKAGTTIFFSSHNLEEVQHYCRTVAIIKEGKIVAIDDMKQVVARVGVKVIVKTKKSLAAWLKREGLNYQSLEDGSIQMMYTGKMGDLVNLLAKYQVEFLRVIDVPLEDIFAATYQK